MSMDSNLSGLSQSDNELKLFCWVLNMSNSPFSVNISEDKTVDDLKEAIWKKKKTAFDGIAYDTLNLWKLSSPIPSSEVGKKLRRTQTLEDIADCVDLDPLDKLSAQFSSPSPPLGHVHIIVQLPLDPLLSSHSVIQSTGSTEDTQIRQLRLLCEKYWNKGEEGRTKIFKNWTVQVPFMPRPGAEGAKGAATTSEEMVIDAEYLATGAQEATPVASAPSGDTSEGSNEGLDEELDLDFDNVMTNCTVFQSLSLGADFGGFFGNDFSSILVRKEYRDMLQHISNLHENGERGVVVTGMPGIGKSFFLSFVLVERILNGQCTAYQCNPSRLILMCGPRDVKIFPANVYLDPQGFPGTWALVDSNVGLVQPRDELTDTRSRFYLVQASSPQPVRWKAWMKELSASMAVMKPWSWEELYIGTTFISSHIDPLTLGNICVKYGRSARHCYNLAKDHAKVTQWEKQIPNLLIGMPDISIFEARIAGNIHHTAESIIEASSQLITIIPDPARQPHVTLVSRHVAQHFFRAVLEHNHEKFWNYFNLFSSVSESRTPGGWLWELYAIRVALSTQRTPISLCHLSPKSSQPLTKKLRVPPDLIELPFLHDFGHGNKEALGKGLSRIIPWKESTLFRPGAPNQATFNAFSISGDNIVTLYQATIRESHSVNAKWLDFIWDALKLAEEDHGTLDAKNLLPSPTRKWRLVFLIPKEAEKHWETAQDIDFGGIKPKRQWGQCVEQFVGVLQKRTKNG